MVVTQVVLGLYCTDCYALWTLARLEIMSVTLVDTDSIE